MDLRRGVNVQGSPGCTSLTNVTVSSLAAAALHEQCRVSAYRDYANHEQKINRT